MADGSWIGRLQARWKKWRRERWRRQNYRRARRIVIGASGVKPAEGWLATNREWLDVTKREHFARFWQPGMVEAFLAEHVWEHLTPEQAMAGIRNCFEFLRPGGRLRLAVPDGYFPSPAYLEHVRPGGTGPGADDHKILWNHETLGSVLGQAGFQPHLLEYWDATGKFHARTWSSADGYVLRCKANDPRNSEGELQYTSLIVDGIKPGA